MKDTIRNYYRTNDFEAEYPEEVTEVRMYMACGITEALRDEEKWPRHISDVLFANDFVLINTSWCNPRNNTKGYHFVAAPTEVHEKYWRRGQNENYLRDTAEHMLAFMSWR